jgi:hypothetical protein
MHTGDYVTTEDVLEDLKSFNEYKNNFYSKVKKFCTDKSIPLNEKWNIFSKTDVGDLALFIYSFPGLDIPEKYKHFFFAYANRNETVDFVAHIEYFEEDNVAIDGIYYEGSIEDHDDIAHDFMTVERMIALKEHLLEKNIKGCHYDW